MYKQTVARQEQPTSARCVTCGKPWKRPKKRPWVAFVKWQQQHVDHYVEILKNETVIRGLKIVPQEEEVDMASSNEQLLKLYETVGEMRATLSSMERRLERLEERGGGGVQSVADEKRETLQMLNILKKLQEGEEVGALLEAALEVAS